MNCEQCKEQISAFLDNELDASSSEIIQMHLAVCAECAKVCEDLAMILDFCVEDEAEQVLSPNSGALWCRINNIIETDVKTEIEKGQIETEPARQGWSSKIFGNSWQMSFSQVFASFLGIALISSLLTIVGIKNFSSPDGGSEFAESATVSETIFEKVLGRIGLMETQQQARARKIQEQQKVIDYWNQRVENRRQNWNGQLRETFDRNLKEIDQVVYEYNSILENNPQDNLTGEMLDAAMKEKMELLRAFSEL